MFVFSSLTAFAEILFFGGIIFGFPSLQYVLEKEGYFEYLCNDNVSREFASRNKVMNFTHSTCPEQGANFNLAFTLGSSILFIAGLPWGFVFDRYGTWVFRSIISTSYTLGYILLTVSTRNSASLLFPVSILFGIAGIGILLSNYQIANLTKSFRGSMMTLMNGLFSSAVVVFFIFKKGYDFGINLYLILQIMSWLTLFLWLRTFLLLPRKSIPFPLPSDGVIFGWKDLLRYCKMIKDQPSKTCTSDSAKSSCNNTKRKNSKVIQTKDGSSLQSDIQDIKPNCSDKKVSSKIADADNINPDYLSFVDTLRNPLCWTNIYHYSVIAFRLSFLFGSVLDWLRSFTEREQISKLTDDFFVILLFGVCVSPLNGVIIDLVRKVMKSRTPNSKILNLKASFVSMLITSVLSIIYSSLALVPSAYGTFIFHTLTRGFLHGGLAAFVASNFPFCHFGKLFGLSGFIAGLFSFLQYGLFHISIHFDPDFYYINIGFLIACVLTLIHPTAIYVQMKKLNNQIPQSHKGNLNPTFKSKEALSCISL